MIALALGLHPLGGRSEDDPNHRDAHQSSGITAGEFCPTEVFVKKHSTIYISKR